MLEPITEQFAVQHLSAALGNWGSRDLPSFQAKKSRWLPIEHWGRRTPDDDDAGMVPQQSWNGR